MLQSFPSIAFSLLLLFVFNSVCAAQQDDQIKTGSIKEFRNKPAPEPAGYKLAYSVDIRKVRKLREAGLECWLTYLRTRLDYRKEHFPDEEFDTSTEVKSAFEEEHQARLALRGKLNEYYELLSRGQKKYADGLNKAYEAGYFAEYVYRSHFQDTWEEAGPTLNLDVYDQWKEEGLGEHYPLTFGTLATQPTNQATAVGILVEDEEIADAREGAFWLRYGLLRFEYLRKNGPVNSTLEGEELVPSFEEELHARTQIYEKNWADIKEFLSAETLNSFEALMSADSAGFKREFVWKFCQREGWEEPDGLRLESFEEWAAENVPDHPDQAPTHAILFGYAN